MTNIMDLMKAKAIENTASEVLNGEDWASFLFDEIPNIEAEALEHIKEQIVEHLPVISGRIVENKSPEFEFEDMQGVVFTIDDDRKTKFKCVLK